MRKFRYRTYIALIIMSLVFLDVLVACQKADSEKFDGMKFACTDIRYSATAGKPTEVIKLNSVPADFGSQLSLIVSSSDAKNSLLVPVTRDANGLGASFHMPVHPSLLSGGGEVKATLIDELDNYCDAVTLHILAIPESPGAYKKLASLLVDVGNVQAQLFNINPNVAPEAQAGNPFAMAHFVVSEFVQGENNPNSLLRMADNESPLLGELSADGWRLIDGLVQQSGIIQALEEYIISLGTLEALPIDDLLSYDPIVTNGVASVGSMDMANSSFLTCGTPMHRPSAEMLDKLMNMQVKNEIFGDDTQLLDAAAKLWDVAGVLATAGGASHAAKVAGGMGTVIDLMKLQYEMMEGLLPSEFIKLNVDVSPVTFLEDDDRLDGRWDKALVTARSRGWSADKVVFEKLLNMLGGRVSKGAQKRFNLNLSEGTNAVGDLASKLWDERLTNELFGPDTDRTGVFEFPSCEFGPTDITDEEWSQVRILPEKDASVKLLDRYTYRAVDTGVSTLEISPRGDRFGRRVFNPNGTFFSKDTNIEVSPIEVQVSPSDMRVVPGTSTQIRATVVNANDKGVVWEVQPAGVHKVTIRTEADGSSVLMIDTSYEEAHFPITITAVSTSTSGLRASPDAPRREGYAIIRSGITGVEIIPKVCCVEQGEKETFHAIVHNLVNQQVTWTASAGTIDKNGVFTAPNRATSVTVTATSVADPTLHDSAIVRVGDCDCWADWEIEAFSEKQSAHVSQMERAGKNGEGRLSKLLFTNLNTGENMQIVFEGRGPLPGETGTYPVQIINTGNDMANRSVLFKNGPIVGVPSPNHDNGFYIFPPPGMDLGDGANETMHDELSATVTIVEFTQLGSDAHHVWISGTIQGQVEAVEYLEDKSLEENMGAVHLIGGIRGSFQGHYTVRHKNPTRNHFAELGFNMPFLGEGSVYWDVCGMKESDIPFVEQGAINIPEMINRDSFGEEMDSEEMREFQEFLNQMNFGGSK